MCDCSVRMAYVICLDSLDVRVTHGSIKFTIERATLFFVFVSFLLPLFLVSCFLFLFLFFKRRLFFFIDGSRTVVCTRGLRATCELSCCCSFVACGESGPRRGSGNRICMGVERTPLRARKTSTGSRWRNHTRRRRESYFASCSGYNHSRMKNGKQISVVTENIIDLPFCSSYSFYLFTIR